MKYLILSAALMLSACTSVPIAPKFPEPPVKAGATVPCQELQKISEAPKISEISKTITANYGLYYECANKVDTWQEWYNTQKKIYEGAVK